MAVRPATKPEAGTRKRTWVLAVTLLALFVAALFLRAYWNLDAAQTEDGTFVLSGGSDPYYHKRAVDAIQESGFQTLGHDPLLNYPYGAVNPNPPVYEWSVAVAGKLLEPFFSATDKYTALQVSTWWAMEWSPAIYGALTVIPIYFLGAALFDRRAGIIAALLWTLSTSAIDATGLGLADHDAAIMFFATLAFLFYIQSIKQFRGDGNWVTRWRDGAAVSSGLGRFVRDRRLGLSYALLAGVAIGAVGLVWKGFPYVIGIMFIYAVLQMIVDHWRNRDSTGLFVGTLVAFLVGTLMTVPYYSGAGVANFLTPVWYMVGAFFVAGLVLVPTRDLPTILVMPAAAIIGALGALVAFFVVPQVANSLLYSAIYFKRTSIYETIAEAHPADFSTIAFGIGPLPFFLAVIGWFVLAFNVRKHPGRPIFFALVWGFIALYFANTAVRFLFNAIPIFCVFAGFYASWLIDWLQFGSIRKSLAANQGNFWHGMRKGVRPLHIIAVVLVAFLFVLPNGLLAADAALPPKTEAEMRAGDGFASEFAEKRLGAYGQGFIPGYWVDALTWLDAHDANITPAERPAFLSWWDYGHWAIAVGKHPAVADNFQNGYEFAANFLLSQNETHAIQLLSARLVDLKDANAEQALGEVGSADPAGDLAKLRRFEFVPDLTMQESVDLLAKIEANTGKRIRYFATDARMLPYDDPQTTGGVDSRSIFHAPVKLAGRGDDEYVSTRISTANGRDVSTAEYETLLRNPISPPQAVGERLDYAQSFFNTMYYRAQVGAPVQGPFPTNGAALAQALNTAQPGYGLEHFRVVYVGQPTAADGFNAQVPTYSVVILEYFPGAIVEGTVQEDGAGVPGVSVTAYDDAGKMLAQYYTEQYRAAFETALNVPHSSAVTDDSGKFRITVPFSMEGAVTLAVSRDGAEVARTNLTVSREDARVGTVIALPQPITLAKGDVEGILFEDVDGDGARNETGESLLAGVNVTIGSRTATTDENGAYAITGVSAGSQTVSLDSAEFEPSTETANVLVVPEETVTHNISATTRPAIVNGTLFADVNGNEVQDEGELVTLANVMFRADANVTGNAARDQGAFVPSDGNFTVTLRPGAYLVEATVSREVTTDGTTETRTFEVRETITVAVGDRLERAFRLTPAAAST